MCTSFPSPREDAKGMTALVGKVIPQESSRMTYGPYVDDGFVGKGRDVWHWPTLLSIQLHFSTLSLDLEHAMRSKAWHLFSSFLVW